MELVDSLADFTRSGRATLSDYAQGLVLLVCWRRLGNRVSVPFQDSIAESLTTRERAGEIIERLRRESPLFEDQLSLIVKIQSDLPRLIALTRTFALGDSGIEFFQEAFAISVQATRLSGAPLTYVPSGVFQLMWAVGQVATAKSVYLPAWGDFRWLPSGISFTADNHWLDTGFWATAWSILSGEDLKFTQRKFLQGPSEEFNPHIRKQFDIVLAVPPAGLRIQADELREDPSGLFGSWVQARSTNADLLFWIMSVAHAPRAVVVSPIGCLFRAGYEVDIRRHLVESGLVHAVVELPGSFMETSAVSFAMVVLGRPHNLERPSHVRFVDATSIVEVEKRRMVFSQRGIDEIVGLVEGSLNREGVSVKIPLGEIAAQDYILSPSRYLQDEKQRIDSATLTSLGTYTLGEIAEIINPQLPSGGPPTRTSSVLEVRVSDFPRAGSIGSEVLTDCKTVAVDLTSERIRRNLLRPWDILLSTKGTVGKVALVGAIQETSVLASQTCHVIRLRQKGDRESNAKALFMYLRSSVGQGQIEPLVTKSTLSHLSLKALTGLLVPILSGIMIEKANMDFRREEELVRQVEQLEGDIHAIHSSFARQVTASIDDTAATIDQIETSLVVSNLETPGGEDRSQKKDGRN